MNLLDEACYVIGGFTIVFGLIWAVFKIIENTPENKRYKEIWESYDFVKEGRDPYGNDVMKVTSNKNQK
jgi:predicted acetyltransferase